MHNLLFLLDLWRNYKLFIRRNVLLHGVNLHLECVAKWLTFPHILRLKSLSDFFSRWMIIMMILLAEGSFFVKGLIWMRWCLGVILFVCTSIYVTSHRFLTEGICVIELCHIIDSVLLT